MADVYYKYDEESNYCYFLNDPTGYTGYTILPEGASVCSGRIASPLPWYKVDSKEVFKFPANASNLFKGAINATDLEWHFSFSSWDLSECTNISHLFDGAVNIPSLDLSSVDFSTIKDMSYMFNGCTSLESVTLGTSSKNADTSKVQSFKNMFKDCTALTTIDTERWSTESCKDFSGMFQNCSSLTTLNVSSFKVSKATAMDNMFSQCTSLEEIEAGELIRWFKSTSATSTNMFLGCTKLRNYDPEKVDINMADSLKEGYFKNYPISIYYKINYDLNKIDYCNHKLDGYEKLTTGSYNYKSVGRYVSITLTYGEFYIPEMSPALMTEATNTGVDTSNWYLKECKYFSYIFVGSKIKSFNFADLDLSNVENIHRLLNNCADLTYVYNIDTIDMTNISEISAMFDGCTSLTEVNKFNKLDLSKIKTLHSLFKNCKSLKRMDLSNMNLSNVTDMTQLFYGCTSLTSVNFSGTIVNSVEKLYNMFNNCKSLTKIDVSMFDTTNLEDASGMFNYCTELKEIYILNWHPTKLTECEYMFANCPNLYLIAADEGTDWAAETTSPSGNQMFLRSPKLINFDENQITIDKANNTRGGYFGVGRYFRKYDMYEKLDDQWVNTEPYIKYYNGWESVEVYR